MKSLIAISFILLPLCSFTQTITTVAGRAATGCSIGGFGGDGGPATLAQLYGPWGLVIDHKGNLLVCDYWNNRIRVVSATGFINTIAGGGSLGDDYGSPYNGMAAALLQLGSPASITVDKWNNFYFTQDNVEPSDVIQVDTLGINRTFVSYEGYPTYGGDGGPATGATLGGYPMGLVFDTAGNLYVGDYSNNVVRKVSTAGVITTVAGNGHGAGVYMGGGYSGDGGPATAAELYYPSGVAIDKYQNLIILDAGNERIRKVNSAGIISTIAGNGSAGFGGDGGPATAAMLNFDMGGGGGIATDKLGDLYVADYNNNRIRFIDSTGVITTVAGTGVAGYSGDGGSPIDATFCSPAAITSDVAGNIYIADYGNNVVRKITLCNNMPAEITGVDTLCLGTSEKIIDSTPGGQWLSGNPIVASVGSTGVVNALNTGVATISYSILPACTVEKQFVVITANAGTITSNITNSFCIGLKFIVQDTVAGGIWSVSNSRVLCSGDTITAVSPGWDTLYYTVTNKCGTAVAVDSFYVPPPIPPITGKLSLCPGDTILLTDSAGLGVWTGGNACAFVTDNMADSGIVAGISPGTAIVTYSFDLGCSTTATITVNPAPPAGTIIGPDSVCKGATLVFTDSVPDGVWIIQPAKNDTIDSITGIVNTSFAESATVLYAMPPNLFGCSSFATRQVKILPAADFSITDSISPIKCYGGTGAMIPETNSGDGLFQYKWNTGDTVAMLLSVPTGTYTLTVSEPATQCRDTAVFTLAQPDSLAAVFMTQPASCGLNNGSAQILVTGATQPYLYSWPGSTGSVPGNTASAIATGEYTVVVTDKNDCRQSFTATVGDTVCPQLVVHDCITPNGDGINDVWVIEGISDYPAAEVQVFDKLGDKIYEKTGYSNDWNGASAPDGTYVYLVTLNGVNYTGGANVFKGTLLIKR